MMFKKILYLNEKTLLAIHAPASQGAKNRLRRRFCFFLTFFLLLLPLISVAQTRVKEKWAARYNGPGNTYDTAYALALDDLGNVYITGYSEGSERKYDYATIKYDNNGNQLWVRRYKGPGSLDDWALDLAVDSKGNVYVTGYSERSRTEIDCATVKYDANGNQIWVRRYKGPRSLLGEKNAIAVDSDGNVYVTCFSYESGTDEDYATIKYDTNGKRIWVARYNGPENSIDTAYDIALDDAKNVYVTGYSHGKDQNFDYATIKYDTDGNQIWVARYDGPVGTQDLAMALALDSDGNVYVTGYSYGIGTYTDYATVKYDTNGTQIWVARYDGPVSGDDHAHALVVDPSGNVYVAGHGEGSGTELDYATIKYDTNGNQIWVRRYDGPMNDADFAPSIALDSSMNVYVTGRSRSRKTGYDYATIKYDTDGNQIWIVRYNGPGNSSDWGEAIAVDSSMNVYVTGASEGQGTVMDYATIKYSQSPSPTLICKTDKSIYNPFDKVQVLADVDNPGDGFSAKLLGGIIVMRTPPKKPIILTGKVVKETIDPGLNPDISLYTSPAFITAIAPKTTHGAFCILYDNEGILVDTSVWSLTSPPDAAQEAFFDQLIRNYIEKYGVENLTIANARDVSPAPASGAPDQTALSSAFPTPANPETWFPFQLSEPGEVTIEIYNASGQLIKTLDLGYKEAGYYLNKEKAAFWDGCNERGERVASGIYFYTMQTRNLAATGKVVILK